MKIKLFPFFAVVSMFCMVPSYTKIASLDHHHDGNADKGEYQKILYMNYRDL